MLRSVPAFVMQGTPSEGTFGMGDAGQIYDRPFTNQEKGAIVGAWGWGYTITQMPGGAVAQLYGAKNTWLWFMSAAGLSSLLIPIGAALGGAGGAIYLVVFLSFVSGLGQGPLYPGKEGLFGSWIPLSEMGHFVEEALYEKGVLGVSDRTPETIGNRRGLEDMFDPLVRDRVRQWIQPLDRDRVSRAKTENRIAAVLRLQTDQTT